MLNQAIVTVLSLSTVGDQTSGGIQRRVNDQQEMDDNSGGLGSGEWGTIHPAFAKVLLSSDVLPAVAAETGCRVILLDIAGALSAEEKLKARQSDGRCIRNKIAGKYAVVG